MIEQNPIACKHVVCFAIIDRDPEGIHFGYCIWGSWIKRRLFSLRHLLHQTIQLRSRCLIYSGFIFQTKDSNGFQQPQRTYTISIGNLLRYVKGYSDMRHGPQIVYLIRLYFLDYTYEISSVRQISKMED